MMIKNLIALFYLISGSVTDLKTREVFDYSNYSLIAIGLAINFLYAAVYDNFMIAVESIAGFLLFFGLAHLMYRTGQWGGGDSKLLMGLGALFGLQFTGFPEILNIFILILLLGAVYGMGWCLVYAVKRWKKVKKKFISNLEKTTRLRRNLIFGGAGAIVVMLLVNNLLINLFVLAMLIATFLGYYMWNFVKAVELEMMYKHIDVDKLTEGDWIVNDVKIDGKKICGPSDLGIKRDQIEKLRQFKKQNKIKKILIKEGIPFVPSFLIGFIASLFIDISMLI